MFERLQLGSGLHAELVDQPRPRRAVGLERFGLAAGAVQGHHALAMQSFSKRMLVHERLELGDQLRVSPGFEVGVESILERREPQLLETTNLGLSEGLEPQVGERRPAPNLQRLPQQPSGALRVVSGERSASLFGECLEAVEVKLTGRGPEHVAVGLGDDPAISSSKSFTQPGDVRLQALSGCRWRPFPPEQLEQGVGGDGLVRAEQKYREQGPLLATADGVRPPIGNDLERPEDPEIHRIPTSALTYTRPRSPASACWQGAAETQPVSRSLLLITGTGVSSRWEACSGPRSQREASP